MKKSTFIFTITLVIFFSFSKTGKTTCYFSNGTNWDYYSNCYSCEAIGFKSNFSIQSSHFCVDRNCEQMLNTGGNVPDDLRCFKCKDGFFLKNSYICYFCPQNATCNGYTMQCNDGYFKNSNTTCQACDPSCKTCSSTKTQCTSCYSGYSLSSGKCIENEAEPTKTNTVNSCPSRMTLSSDGCCCINK